jgi:hypothetical protein
MDRNRNIASRDEIARQVALQEAARALAARPPELTSTKLQVGEQLLEALASTGPGRPRAMKPLPMKYAQLRNISKPHANDVLVGNALGSGNIHAGNILFSKLVNSQKLRYLQQTDRVGRENVARDIVRAIRAQNPPGRFLQKTRRMYDDIGALDAIEYTSHSLRQGTHELAKMIAATTPSEIPSFFAAAKQGLVSDSGPLVAAAAPPPSLDAIALLLASIPGNPSLSGEAPIWNSMLPQSRGDPACDAIAQAMTEIMNARVRHQANVSQLTEAAARVASFQSHAANSSKLQSRLVAPFSTQMPTLAPGISNIPLHPHAGGPGGSLLPPLGHDLSDCTGVASQLGNILMQQQALNPLPDSRQSLVTNQSKEQGEQLISDTRNEMLSCSKDLVERLVSAETMAQRTVQGTVTDALKAEEKRKGLYLDAGLLGIDLREMMERRKGGQSEESIIEEYFAKLRQKRDDDDDGEKKRSVAKKPPAKKQRVVSVIDHAQDSDALSAVGAMIQLQRQTSLDCETETESESD